MSIANELITRGWCQKALLKPETGAVCLLGAVICASSEEPLITERDVYEAPFPSSAVSVLCGLVGLDIATWNNDPDRTFDEVLRVAKEADEILDA